MSWKILNEVTGRAIIDPEFCQKLLAHPVETIETAGYKLTEHERQSLQNIHASDIYEFSERLLIEVS